MNRKCLLNQSLVWIAITLFFISCSSKPQEQDEEYIEIGFSSNFIDYEEAPMYSSTKSFTDRDIFGVEIHDEEGNKYAAWLTSDLSTESVRLLKNKRYVCYLAYMPSGKDIVETHTDGTLGLPFNAMGTAKSPALNGGVKYGNYSISHCNFGCVYKVGVGDPGWYANNLWNDVEIYCGITEIYSNKDISLTIDLYRMMFGLRVSVQNFSEGEVRVSESTSRYVYTLTPSNPTMDKVLELRYMPWDDFFHTPDDIPTPAQLREWSSDGYLTIVYVAPDGEELTILKRKISTKRLTRYSYSFDLEDILSDYFGTLSARITDGEWSEENL